MSNQEFTNLRVTEEELDALSNAAESAFGSPDRISYGAMIRLMAADYMENSN